MVFIRQSTTGCESRTQESPRLLPSGLQCYRLGMWTQKWMLLVGLLTAGPAVAGSKKLKRAQENGVLAANASDIPALAGLLGKAGWTPTPELSGVFQVGRIFKDDGTGHSLMVRDCFEVEAGSDPYTSSEVVSNLQAGVRVGLGVRAKTSASLVRSRLRLFSSMPLLEILLFLSASISDTPNQLASKGYQE